MGYCGVVVGIFDSYVGYCGVGFVPGIPMGLLWHSG